MQLLSEAKYKSIKNKMLHFPRLGFIRQLAWLEVLELFDFAHLQTCGQDQRQENEDQQRLPIARIVHHVHVPLQLLQVEAKRSKMVRRVNLF